MSNLQVKNVPEPVHRQLRELAASRGCRLRDVVLDAVVKELRRAQMVERLKSRAPVSLTRPAARYLEEARAERDGQT